jgi:hypothetical protein
MNNFGFWEYVAQNANISANIAVVIFGEEACSLVG